MESIFVIFLLIFSVVVHEVSHGYAALALGDPTARLEGRLTLNPMAHLDPIGSLLVPIIGYLSGGVIIGWAKPVPYNPYNLRNQRWGEALVAIAGPLSNIIVAVTFALIVRGGQDLISEKFLFLASYLIFINIILALFNMIPIPPLDGSKVLFSFLPYRFENIRRGLERYGLILVLLFVFIFWRLILPIAFFIFTALVGRPLF